MKITTVSETLHVYSEDLCLTTYLQNISSANDKGLFWIASAYTALASERSLPVSLRCTTLVAWRTSAV